VPMNKQSTERFTNRVENYVRYRPNYPDTLIPLLEREIGLTPAWEIADVGSGPGNLTRQFLAFGSTVFAIEPNPAMREAGEVLMNGNRNFTSVAGTAEATTLPASSVDLVTAGQAFHWFEPEATRIEFQRILRKPGWAVLVWNRRMEGASQVLDEHHEMLQQFSPDYGRVAVSDRGAQQGMGILFGEAGYREFSLRNEQLMDEEAYWGRLLSSSYVPLPGQAGHDDIRRRSQEIFEAHAEDGILRFPYETKVFVGKVLT
jgi:SAM-dependent methyltransferase